MTTRTTTPEVLERIGRERLLDFLYQMVFLRRFEERAGELYTKGKIRGFLHLYTGQEACAVGSISVLRPEDRVVSHYRDHGHAIVKGVDPKTVMAELFGKATGCAGGRGGSMHLFDVQKNFLGGYAIVAGHMPIAVGLALAAKMSGEDWIAMCIFGDGSIAEGEFHESLNLAALWKVPVLWFCENNLYGMGVHLKESLVTDITKLAAAYEIPAVKVDGMDVVAVHEATREAVEYVRREKRPYFIEAETYRYRGHSMADPELYRVKEEVEQARKRDCIERLRRQLEEVGWLDEAGFHAINERAEAEVEACVQFAEESPEPGIETLYDHVLKGDPHGRPTNA
ncbi:Acetoin:2,6-dichlorophenolindophenol oxidoreductase subunit alpha [bacterium HR29]|jgi:pyruvate dehydrogenase E1 component alpha subunit|nr:Acetoin:2,6-dichlorophenolindophenol oxidoreductase subunit alpha [bacterium HR29]